mgnify:CR=1 FL=1
MPVNSAKPESVKLFDTHCHLDLPELAAEQARHWRDARQAGVAALLIPAVEQVRWQALLALKQQQSDWQIALGVHPWWAQTHDLSAVSSLERLLAEHNDVVCAVGEIGLDFALNTDSFAKQAALFSAQLALAKKHNKPVILHHRKSQPQLLAELKRQQFTEGGILHAFSGSQQQGKAFVDLGFKLGIGGTITYDRAEKTRKTVAKLPLSCFVLETDAPSMPLSGFQGGINTPSQLAVVFQAFCQLRSESAEQIAKTLWQNSCEVLRLRAA